MKKKRRRIFILGVAVIGTAILTGFVWNTIQFDRFLKRMVSQYMINNNQQMTARLSYHLEASREFIADFADTLSRMPEFLLTEDLLQRKSRAIEVQQVAVVSKEMVFFPELQEKDVLTEWIEENEAAWEEPQISYLKNQYILFSAPVINDGKAVKLVIGLQSYGALRNIIDVPDYQKYGVNILFDRRSGERIMTERGTFTELSEEKIASGLETVQNKSSEDCEIKSTRDGENFVVSCSVEGTEWDQIAMTPSNFLIKKSGGYLDIYFGLVGGILCSFLAIIHYLMKENRRKEQFYYTDPLTGGLNREGFLQAGKKCMAQETKDSYAVAYLNIMKFRQINENWGEEDGNRTLKFIYQSFSGILRKNERVCRNGVDHFFLLLCEKENEDLKERLTKAVDQVNEVICQKFYGYTMNFSMGACRLTDEEQIAAAMSKAIYVAKLGKEPNTCYFYNEDTAQKVNREKMLDELFEESLKNHDFKLFFQPKVPLEKGKKLQAEVLVRWIHPREGMIYPNEFIPFLEMNGKIGKLDRYMLEETCRLLAGWISEKREVPEVSINVSRFHLRSEGVEVWKKYQEIKNQYQIPDGLVELELTETILLDETQISFVKNILKKFRACGFKIALDDFGFAYSSLALLKEFEVDTLKLDRMFFVNETEKSKKIVANVIRLAHSLDISVVAEGIEREEQAEALKEAGCDLIQGYVYAKPMTVEEFGQWRKQYETREH